MSRYFTSDLAFALSPEVLPASAPKGHHDEHPVLSQIRRASPAELGEIIKALQAKVNQWTKDVKPLTYGQHKIVQREMAAWVYRQEWELNAQFPDLDIKLPQLKKASPPLQERRKNQLSTFQGQHPSWQRAKQYQPVMSWKRRPEEDYQYQVKRQRQW